MEKFFNTQEKISFFKELHLRKVKFYDADFTYPEPEKRTRNFEFATRTELYTALNKLKKLIEERLAKGGEEKITLTPEEEELYEKLMDVWGQEENLYFG